ncbi:hypothetical protein ACFV4M_02055 [Kitasatospora indigofera]|uniref:hypothetical protein n=1 Tax=Kitasatospora indigofera TaxID=67307 RepID=UPI003658B466
MTMPGTAAAEPVRARSTVFDEDDRVAGSLPGLLPGAVGPRFGSRVWDFNGVVRRRPNLSAHSLRISFDIDDPVWHLRAREVAMISLNRHHEAVEDRQVYLPVGSMEIKTVQGDILRLRRIALWAAAERLPADLGLWTSDDVHRFVAEHRQHLKVDSVQGSMRVLRQLHAYGPALTGGGLDKDPFDGKSMRAWLDFALSYDLSTPPIPPEIWFPLVRGAWTYIADLGPDILRARSVWHRLQEQTRTGITRAEGTEITRRWLADPANLVPVGDGSSPSRRATVGTRGALPVNWQLLSRFVGLDPELNVFSTNTLSGPGIRALAQTLADQGRTTPGLISDLAEVERPDGTRGPWHPGLHPRQLWLESTTLRNACYVFIAAMSMMRDSEIREITKDAVTPSHYGSPAVASVKTKLDPARPVEHWWVIEPVARAVNTAAELSLHDELAFSGMRLKNLNENFVSADAVKNFIARVNKRRHLTGLAEIPTGRVAPHMFRRTMAMLTREFPGAEIAIGIQLKHTATRALANRVTEGYYAPAPSWSKHFDTALAASRFARLRDLYDSHRAGQDIGYGPGADRLRKVFDTVAATADEMRSSGQARHGDVRVEHELLRKTRFSIRFGKLNHCTMDDANPAGAKCIEDAIMPPGHVGPLIDRCQPGRCANSVIAPEHIPIWTAERSSLATLQDNPKLPPARRLLVQQQISDVEDVLRKARS